MTLGDGACWRHAARFRIIHQMSPVCRLCPPRRVVCCLFREQKCGTACVNEERSSRLETIYTYALHAVAVNMDPV